MRRLKRTSSIALAGELCPTRISRTLRLSKRSFCGFGICVALLAATAPAWGQFAGRASRVNIDGTGVQANNESWAVALSADGKLVAFASDADNLVSLDTNEDSDIFLHDTNTGITSRVSMNWQGKQAAGDSDCPAISGDGRYIAFRSRASNMLQEGSTVGSPAWEVFLHDRQGPLTIQISRPLQGGPGTADSGCPEISKEGTHLAFASEATDLIVGDTNGFSDIFVYRIADGTLSRASVTDTGAQADGDSIDPAISGDGSIVAFSSTAENLTPALIQFYDQPQVYVRDSVAATTELISREAQAPVLLARRKAREPELSADGTLVLFFAKMDFLEPTRLFLFDRTTGLTDSVESLALAQDRPAPGNLLADVRSWTDAAAISADGRFIAFMSGSFALLPVNSLFHTDQIFILDRKTRRLRRVTVDPTGYPLFTHPCGGSSSTLALSADGLTLAFVGENTERIGLSPTDGLAIRDVVRLQWTCDPQKESCRTASQCPDKPAETCVPARGSRLLLRRNPPLSSSGTSMRWRWRGPPATADQAFPDPTASGSAYQICLYAGDNLSPQMDAPLPAEASWRRMPTGWEFKYADGAVQSLRMRNRENYSLLQMTSRSPILDQPYLPLDVPRGVSIQLHETTTGRCWGASFNPESITRNRRGQLGPGGISRGVFRAKVN